MSKTHAVTSQLSDLTLLKGSVRWALVAVFLLASVQKLVEPARFADSLRVTGFFPSASVPILSYAVPLLECAAALLIAFRFAETPALAVLMFLSGAFSALHAYLYVNGIIAPCGCAGIIETASGQPNHLFLSLFCAALFAGVVFLTACPHGSDGRPLELRKNGTAPTTSPVA